jgi:hypothetical protein
MKLEISRRVFQKKFKHQIERKSVQWEPSRSMQTDREADQHEEANSRSAQFCERAENCLRLFGYPWFTASTALRLYAAIHNTNVIKFPCKVPVLPISTKFGF